MKYRDILTILLVVGFFLSLGYAFGVSKSAWFWVVPIVFGAGLIWAAYYLWLT